MSEQIIQADSSASEKVCDHPSTEKADTFAWAVRKSNGAILVKTISDTRRAAIVNWLVVEKRLMIYSHHTDEEIEAMWKHHGTHVDCRVVHVRAAPPDGQVIANPANSLGSQPESSEPSLLGRETVREALEEIEKIAGVVGYVGFEICADLAADLLKQVETIRACERPSDDTDNIAWDILAEERLGQRPRERPSLSPLKE